MSIPTIRYPDNETAAHAVYAVLKRLTPPVRHLALRSSGARARGVQGRAAFGEWQLVPANTPGPHRHGRLALRRLPENPNQISVGFGATRGLGRQLEELADPAVMMDGTWFWRSRLVGDIFAGALEAPIRAVVAATGQPVFVSLDLTRFDTVPDAIDVLIAPPFPVDRLVFRIRDDARSLSPIVLPEHELSPLASSPALRDLILHIEALPDLWWAWIDLHIGVHMAYGDEATPGAWDAGALWSHALAPWLPWVH